MSNDSNLMSQTLADNDDIRELISVVDSDFRRYDEITFKESVDKIYNKWPLLDEVNQSSQHEQKIQTENNIVRLHKARA